MRIFTYASLLLIAITSVLPAQSGAITGVPSLLIGDDIEILQRTNFSIRENGRYAGHTQRERRLRLVADTRRRIEGDGSFYRDYSGEYMLTENTIRDLRTVATRVSDRTTVAARFDGSRLTFSAGIPVSSGLPTIISGDVPGRATPGGWEAPAVALIDADGGRSRSIPVIVAYRPVGTESYQGEQVFRIEFGYTLRWPRSTIELEEHPAAPLIDERHLPGPAVQIRGNRQGVLLIPVGGGVPVLHRTDVEEQVVDGSGNTTERRGFVLTWYRTPEVRASVYERVRSVPIPEVTVERDQFERVRLSIRNLQFVADQAVLLPGESNRLDAVAALLSEIEDVTILVTGHTADVGSQQSQEELSIARARQIVDALISRGVPPGRLRYEGRGGVEPIGDNATETGRARNRRVEITLLPD